MGFQNNTSTAIYTHTPKPWDAAVEKQIPALFNFPEELQIIADFQTSALELSWSIL